MIVTHSHAPSTVPIPVTSSTSSTMTSSIGHGNFGAIGPPNRRNSLPGPPISNHFGRCGLDICGWGFIIIISAVGVALVLSPCNDGYMLYITLVWVWL